MSLDCNHKISKPCRLCSGMETERFSVVFSLKKYAKQADFNFLYIYSKYSRQIHNDPLARQTGASCLVIAPLETAHFTSEHFWKDISCKMKAPFICKYNSDFLGFHKLRNLIIDKTIDVTMDSMSLTTCIALCQASIEPTHIVFLLKKKCICAKGIII